MKNIFVKCLALLFVFAACTSEEEDVFDKTAHERIKEKKEQYHKILQEAEFGWEVEIKLDEGDAEGYKFFMDFDSKDKVMLVSDLVTKVPQTTDCANAVLDSSFYDIRYDQDVELVFSTFSQVNFFYDPNNSKGKSLGGDIELLFKEVTEDQIIFKGKVNGSTFIFKKAKTDEFLKQMVSLRQNKLIFKALFQINAGKFPVILLDNGQQISFSVDSYYNSASFTFNAQNDEGKTVIEQKTLDLIYINGEVLFSEPLKVGGQQVSGFKFDKKKSTFVTREGDMAGQLSFVRIPPIEVPGVFDRFMQNKKLFALSFGKGFEDVVMDIQKVSPRFLTIGLINDPEAFSGFVFFFSDPLESHYGIFEKENGIEKLGEDILRFNYRFLYSPSDSEIKLKEVLTTPEGFVLYSLLFDEKGFKVVERDGKFQMISIKNPSVWFNLEAM